MIEVLVQAEWNSVHADASSFASALQTTTTLAARSCFFEQPFHLLSEPSAFTCSRDSSDVHIFQHIIGSLSLNRSSESLKIVPNRRSHVVRR